MTGQRERTCAMPKPPEAVEAREAKSRGQRTAGKLRLYEILYDLNQGFAQVLGQLYWKSSARGHQPWNVLRVIVEENHAEVNLDLVEHLAEREERDWTYFGKASPPA
jgi:hypothetical protein